MVRLKSVEVRDAKSIVESVLLGGMWLRMGQKRYRGAPRSRVSSGAIVRTHSAVTLRVRDRQSTRSERYDWAIIISKQPQKKGRGAQLALKRPLPLTVE